MAAKVAPIPPPFFSPYLDDQCNKINSKPVPWEGYQRAKLVSAEEVQLLKSLSKLPPGQRNTAYSTQGAQYASLYVNLLRKLQRVDTVQAVLVAITEMLSDPSSSATTLPLYHNLRSSEQPDDPYGPLVKCLGQEEEFAVLAALRLLGLLVATDPQPFPESLLSPFLKSLSSLLNNSRQPLWEVAAQVLGAVLSKKQFRSAVWKEEGCISGLVKALKGSPTPQAQYWAGLAVWELSFEEQAARGFDRKYQIIEVLTAVAKSAVKEKVSRMVIATFRNLLTLAPSQSLPSFFTNHTLELAQSLKARKWSDEDVTEDLDYLVGELKGRLEGLTTYDEYVSELESGKLVWSPTHESEDFWKENAGKVGGDEGGKGIKRLVELLKSSDDPLVLSIAASDIGQFIKYANVPDKAKATVADLGGKTRMIELMGHANPEVRYRALMSVQRLMSLHA